MFARLASAPWFIYVKLALVASLVCGAAWASWQVRDAQAIKEQTEVVSKLKEKYQKDLDDERWMRGEFQRLIDEHLNKILISISGIREQSNEIAKRIEQERRANPEFYKQALPAGGYEEWKRARQLVGSSAASSPRP